MKIEIVDGKVSISLQELICQAAQDDRVSVIQTLACTDEVINEVANQIIDGYTSEGWHGSRGYGGNADATYGIDGARMRIAKASSDIAAKEIEALKAQIDREKESAQRAWDAYHKATNPGHFA